MQFLGEFRIKIFDPATPDNPKVDEVKQNIITKRTVERLLMDNQSVFVDTLRIAISTFAYPAPNYEQDTIQDVIAIGGTAGAAGRVFTDQVGNTAPFVTIQNSFVPPIGSDRDFITVGVVTGTTDNDTANITSDAWAWTTYGSTFTQTTTEQLEVTYKVSLVFTAPLNNIRDSVQRALQLLLLDEGGTLDYRENGLNYMVYSPSNPNDDFKFPNVSIQQFIPTDTLRVDLLKRESDVSITFPADTYCSGLIFGRLEENNGTSFRSFKGAAGIIPFPTVSNIGTVFGHNTTTDALYFDPVGRTTSDYKPLITETALSDRLNTIYSLLVESSGGVGAGTYAIYRSLYSGGEDDADWNQRPRLIVGTSSYPYFEDDETEIPYDSRWIYEWKTDKTFVSGNQTKIAVWQLSPEFIILSEFDIGTSNSVLQINDIATDPDNDLILVATEQGLISINTDTTAVTVLNSDRCRAVEIANGNEIFAVFINGVNVGRLSSTSIGYGAAHDTTGVTINWERVAFIRSDVTSIDYRLAIIEFGLFDADDEAGVVGDFNNQVVYYLHWWDNVSKYVNTINVLSNAIGTNVYHSRSLALPYNSSVVVGYDSSGTAVWVFPKRFRNSNIVSGSLRGYPKSFAKTLVANGETILDADQRFIASTAYVALGQHEVGAAQFNQELRAQNFVSTNSLWHSLLLPSYAVLEVDLTGGILNLAIGGYHNILGSSQGYNEAIHQVNSVGAFSYTISTSDATVNGYARYKGELYGKYNFSPYNSNLYQDECYALGGNIKACKEGGILSFNDSSVSTSKEQLAGGNRHTNTFFHPISIGVFTGHDKVAMHTPYAGFAARYGWDPAANGGSGGWERDDAKVFGGKPLHLASETAIDNIDIGFNDEDIGNSNPFVINEHYEFTRVESGAILDGTIPANKPLKFGYVLRPVVDYVMSQNIPAAPPYEVTITPQGTDPLFFGIDGFDTSDYALTIGGAPATIILSGSPAVGELLVQNTATGTYEANAADAGALIAGLSPYFQKIHPTEVL